MMCVVQRQVDGHQNVEQLQVREDHEHRERAYYHLPRHWRPIEFDILRIQNVHQVVTAVVVVGVAGMMDERHVLSWLAGI